MEVFYNKKLIKNNQFLKISETQLEPEIKLNVNKNDIYTLILFDPDAINGTFIHWTVVNITNNDIKTGRIIIPYKGPSPPPKTGKHRYIFNLYKQDDVNNSNPFTEKVFELSEFKKLLNVHDPIVEIKFISENNTGGKRKTKKRRQIKKKSKRRK